MRSSAEQRALESFSSKALTEFQSIALGIVPHAA
jgi:hypothetical protein